jgi:hypothetical protein
MPSLFGSSGADGNAMASASSISARRAGPSVALSVERRMRVPLA